MTDLPKWLTRERAVDVGGLPWVAARRERNRMRESIDPFVRDRYFPTEARAALAAAAEWDQGCVDAEAWRDRAEYLAWRTRDLMVPM